MYHLFHDNDAEHMHSQWTLCIHQTIRIPAEIDPSTFKKVVPAMAGEA